MRLVPVLAALVLLAAPANAFRSESSLQVAAENATDFIVKYRSTAKLTDYWCAAGDYVVRGLALDGRTPIYRLSPPPRKAGQGIRFTLDPARGSGETGLSAIGKASDGSISAVSARSSYCFEVDLRQN